MFRNNPTTNFEIKFHSIPSYIPREGTGIQKFKRSRWSATDESPPKKKKTETDSGTAHFAFVIYYLCLYFISNEGITVCHLYVECRTRPFEAEH
jgi:hypothetical protein